MFGRVRSYQAVERELGTGALKIRGLVIVEIWWREWNLGAQEIDIEIYGDVCTNGCRNRKFEKLDTLEWYGVELAFVDIDVGFLNVIIQS